LRAQPALENSTERSSRNDLRGVYRELGEIYSKLGDYVTAKEYHERALAIGEQTLEEGHPEITVFLNNMEITCYRLGEREKAKEYYERALAMRTKALEDDNMAYYYDNNYELEGAREKAKKYYERASAVREKILRYEHLDTETAFDKNPADSLHNQGMEYYRLEDYMKAKECFERASNMRLKDLGEEHPDTALSFDNLRRTYNELGIAYSGLGDYTKTKECERRLIAIRTKLQGG
jgi:tetratricopeptide (TPR) repeat protein